MVYIFAVLFFGKKGPEKHTAEESQQDGAGTVIVFGSREVNDIAQDRDVHTPDHQGMGLCQCFQEIILKKAGLAFIMNLFEFHSAKITTD